MSNTKINLADGNQKQGFTRLGWLWFLVMIVLTFAILASTFLADRVSLAEGDIAPSNVYYFGTATTFTSQIYTEQAQQLAAGEVEQIYKYDEKVAADMQVQVDTLFDALHAVRVSDAVDEAKLLELNRLLTPPVAEGEEVEPPSQAILEYFLGLDDAGENLLRNSLKNAVSAAYGLGEFDEEALPEVEEQCRANIAAIAQSGRAANFMRQAMLLLEFKPTHVFDQVATMDAISQAISSVQPISITVYPGQDRKSVV